VTLTPSGRRIVTEAVADFVLSACEVALTVTLGGFGAAFGAVYRPVCVMVPQALPEQIAPLKLQVTLLSLVPVTVAVNCRWCPIST
jgi:hypothetical protein